MATKARSLKEFSSATSQILSARHCELQQTAQKILNADHHNYLTVVLASDWDYSKIAVSTMEAEMWDKITGLQVFIALANSVCSCLPLTSSSHPRPYPWTERQSRLGPAGSNASLIWIHTGSCMPLHACSLAVNLTLNITMIITSMCIMCFPRAI